MTMQHYKLYLQEWLCFLLSPSCTQDMFMFASHSEVLFRKGREWGSALAPSLGKLFDSASSLSCSRISAPLSEDLPSETSSNLVILEWAQIFHVAGHPIHHEGLWADYFGHLTSVELCGILTLWSLDPHTISNLVRPGLKT